MTTWEIYPTAPLVDGCRVRIGDGPLEGMWRKHDSHKIYAGTVLLALARGLAYVPHGCRVTVLREVKPERTLGDDVGVVLELLRTRNTDPDAWTPAERRAVTRLFKFRDNSSLAAMDLCQDCDSGKHSMCDFTPRRPSGLCGCTSRRHESRLVPAEDTP